METFEQFYQKMTAKEREILNEFHLRENQLKNFRIILNSATPKKAEKLEKNVLPGYITREYNARQQAKQMMKKKGLGLR